jgi:hypothetical protein
MLKYDPRSTTNNNKSGLPMRLVLGASLLAFSLSVFGDAQAQAQAPSPPPITDADWAAYLKAEERICNGNYEACLALHKEFVFAHWPVPQPTEKELQQPCRPASDYWTDNSVGWYVNSPELSARGGGYMRLWIDFWASRYMQDRVYARRPDGSTCIDGRFRAAQWQRAVGMPQTGKFSKADVDDFVTRWGPIIARVKDSAAARIAGLQSAARDKAGWVERRREQEQRELAAVYANGPSIFGVRLGSTIQELVDCGNHQPGMSFNPLNIRVPTTCYESFDRTLRFPPKEQPGWVNGSVKLGLDVDVVFDMSFKTNDVSRAVQTIDSRFGSHRTSEVPVHQKATRWCDDWGNCVAGQPERHWIEATHTWESEKLLVEVTGEKGLPEASVTIYFKPVEQARKIRAQAEQEIGREDREKAERQQRQF